MTTENKTPHNPPISSSRPNSMQQKLMGFQQQYNAKPITIRTNSMTLPGFTQPRTKSRLGRLYQQAQHLVNRVKRFHKYHTRRSHDRNWYRIASTLILFIVFILAFRSFLSILSSFIFSKNPRPGPRMTETINALESLNYISSTGNIIHLDKNKLYSGVRRSRLYSGSRIRRQIMDSQKDPIINVVNSDSLDEALKLKRLGFKPIVLDMANREFPGGDYRSDGTTQEAGLFRRTNLYQCLDTEPRKSEYYPIPSQGAVYCPNMIVIRKSDKDNNEFLDRPEWMSFLAVPPLRNPPLVPNEANEMVLGERAVIITKKKIQHMFRVALENGHDAIVLSAFGCGRLHNPPESVANIFKEIIHTNYMGGVKKGRTFSAITFAITNYTALDQSVKNTHNYDTFKQIMDSPFVFPEEAGENPDSAGDS